MPRKIAFFLAVLFAAAHASAAVFVVPTDRAMIRRAEAIVLGTAEDSYSQLLPNGAIETVTRFRVEEVLKGGLRTAAIDVHEPGGIVGGEARLIAGVPQFTPGERSVLFLSRTPQRTWAVTDIALGKFVFARDVAGHRLLMRSEDDVVGWDRDGKPHREPRRHAEKFLQFLRTELRNGMGLQDYEVPWAPLEKESTTSTKSLITINATFSARSYTSDIGSGLGSRWNVFPTAVTHYTQPGTASNGVSAAAAALAAWTNEASSNISYQHGGNDPCSPSCHTGGLTGSPDNFNTILFERNLSSLGIGPFSCSGSSYGGTLGIGGITSAANQHAGPNGETFWTTREVDVEMNQGVLGCAALGGNLNSAVTHEVGHTLGFRHSDQTRANNPGVACSSDPSLECSSTAIMRSSVPSGLNGVLQAFDRNAATAVYPGASPPPPPPANKAIRDFDGDGKSDVFWRNTSTGSNMAWLLNMIALRQTVPIMGVADQNWKFAGAADFNADGSLDLIWRNQATGKNVIWYMNRTAFVSSAYLPDALPLSWHIEATGDLNGDNRPDIIFHNHANGWVAVWLMNDRTRLDSLYVSNAADLNWHIAGAGDFNGDGNTDLLWRHATSGLNCFWRLSGTRLVEGVWFDGRPDLGWKVGGVADYDLDGTPDIFWHHSGVGANVVWTIRNFRLFNSHAASSLNDPSWIGAGPR